MPLYVIIFFIKFLKDKLSTVPLVKLNIEAMYNLFYLKSITTNLLVTSSLAMAVMQMRGLLRKQVMRDILTAVTLGWAVGAVWWFGVAQPRRKVYEEFYRNYDAKAVAASTKASFEEGKDVWF